MTSDEPAILFVGRIGDDKEICAACEQQLETLMESNNLKEVKEAISYLHSCSLSTGDSEVASFLTKRVEANRSMLEELEDEATKITSEHVGSIWISGMKVVAWITFFGTIFCGLMLTIKVGQEDGGIAFLIFIGSIVAAFLSVAMSMVFLNLAQDVSEIKHILREKNKE